MLKQSLQQKLGLKINPLQIQLIKLLELPTYQLEQRIKEELESNPLLEEGEEKPEPEVDFKEGDDEVDYEENAREEEEYNSTDDEFSLDDYISDDDDIPDYRLSSSNASKDDDAREFVLSGGISFRENLVQQLGTQHLRELDRKICEYIIGNIDDDGYLRRDVENIVDDLAFGVGIEVDDAKIESLLKVVQQFEGFARVSVVAGETSFVGRGFPRVGGCPYYSGGLFRGIFQEALREDFQADEDFGCRAERGGGRDIEIEPEAGWTDFRFVRAGCGKDYTGF